MAANRGLGVTGQQVAGRTAVLKSLIFPGMLNAGIPRRGRGLFCRVGVKQIAIFRDKWQSVFGTARAARVRPVRYGADVFVSHMALAGS